MKRGDNTAMCMGFEAMKTVTIGEAVAALQRGEVVAMPTETVYGLAADAQQPEAVAKVFAVKGRPSARPLIVHVASPQALDEWAEVIPDYARRWAEVFWPGPLTLVLKKQAHVSEAITAGQDTVALRMPNHPMALALLKAFGGGLVAPSANRYRQLSPTTAEAVADALSDHSPLILDGGPCQVGIESTIVLCTGERPQILRPGMISRQALTEVGGITVLDAQPSNTVVVPGQDRLHYAPRTPAQLLSRPQIEERLNTAQRVGVLAFAPFETSRATVLTLPRQPEAAARALYAALRTLDQAGLDALWIEQPPEGEAWSAIADRLRRATAQAVPEN